MWEVCEYVNGVITVIDSDESEAEALRSRDWYREKREFEGPRNTEIFVRRKR